MDAMEKLKVGYKNFLEGHYVDKRRLYKELVKEGQSPKVCVIACADSRVSPATILGTEPGDIFVVRNVANLVPPYQPDTTYHGTSAALEYAVHHLNVEHILVLGHAYCGGIRALFQDIKRGTDGCYFIPAWIDIARSAHRQVLETHPDASVDEQASACEKAAILVSLENLKGFPCIRDGIGAGTLALHGWHIDIDSGSLTAYNEEAHRFEDIGVK